MIYLDINYKDSNDGNSATSAHFERDVYYDLGETPLTVLGEIINSFIHAIGYYSFDEETILMTSLKQEEADYLLDCLEEYRKNLKKD